MPATPTAQSSPTSNRHARSVPASVYAAVALVTGVFIGSLLPMAISPYLLALFIWLCAAIWFHRSRKQHMASLAIGLSIVCLGICHWQVANENYQRATLKELAITNPSTVQLRATIESVPVVSVRPSSEFSPRLYGDPEQTRFIANVSEVVADQNQRPLAARCQVYVDGDVGTKLSAGDYIQLTGKLNWPEAPANPGEFDYQTFLMRQQIAGLLFVKHPEAIQTIKPATRLSVGWFITRLRQTARAAILASIDREVQPIALALLLGNRNELATETEEAFIASGTMHLLAISGLHVGILCVFLLQIMNLLLVPRNRALLLTAAVCWTYATVTDLRPSVVRAAVFFSIFVCGQLLGRNQRTSALIAVTVLLMVACNPNLIFETGAWLSFLSVAALGWVGSITTKSAQESEHSEVPTDAISPAEKLRSATAFVWRWTSNSYRRMIFILAFTTPLVVSSFHVVSPIGLIVNILLIPATAVALCIGFITLFVGMLMPQWPSLASIPGSLFSMSLKWLVWIVETAAEFRGGHLYLPDLPPWFIPCYYLFLTASLLAFKGPRRNLAICGMLICLTSGGWIPAIESKQNQLTCTILAVGHGNAVVVETGGGRVYLIDAGAMNRGSRTADVVTRYLWTRGHNRIDGIFISHADLDHYNAIGEILTRIPVAEILTSCDVLQSESYSVKALLARADQLGVAVHEIHHLDTTTVDGANISILHAEPSSLPHDAEDNERSLVVRIDANEKSIVLTGDLEGLGAEVILPQLNHADVLISPHHGSKASNNEAVAQAIQPQFVVVSSRDTSQRERLEQVYSTSDAVYFTSECGAIETTLSKTAPIQIRTHHTLKLP